ncbi:hypothetical protein CDD81_7105 [Ophiocordyceps australis]|uniref:Uncharacterized protein n=1 Tax=Ophiocordyceps australis TaxID=1399860 RepID=A0A2C5XH57_9HYPO|nr:hypothetical protein CDD81_7105 [Ophiocordyceps australis]
MCGITSFIALTGPRDSRVVLYEANGGKNSSVVTAYSDGEQCVSESKCSQASEECVSSDETATTPSEARIYAVERTRERLRLWTWPSKDAPRDINNAAPNPQTWGAAAFDLDKTSCGTKSFLPAMKLQLGIRVDHSLDDMTKWRQGCAQSTGHLSRQIYFGSRPEALHEQYFHLEDIRWFKDSGKEAMSGKKALNKRQAATDDEPVRAQRMTPVRFSRPQKQHSTPQGDGPVLAKRQLTNSTAVLSPPEPVPTSLLPGPISKPRPTALLSGPHLTTLISESSYPASSGPAPGSSSSNPPLQEPPIPQAAVHENTTASTALLLQQPASQEESERQEEKPLGVGSNITPPGPSNSTLSDNLASSNSAQPASQEHGQGPEEKAPVVGSRFATPGPLNSTLPGNLASSNSAQPASQEHSQVSLPGTQRESSSCP